MSYPTSIFKNKNQPNPTTYYSIHRSVMLSGRGTPSSVERSRILPVVSLLYVARVILVQSGGRIYRSACHRIDWQREGDLLRTRWQWYSVSRLIVSCNEGRQAPQGLWSLPHNLCAMLSSVSLWSCDPECGLVAFWSFGLVVLWPYGLVALWSCVFVALRSFGLLVFWSCGLVILWSCGLVVLWSFGLVTLLPCSLVTLWPCSRVALRLVRSGAH